MVDNDLLEELEAAVRSVGGVNSLPEREAADCIRKLASSFVADSNSNWWWESLTKPSKRIAYGSMDGVSILATLVEPKSEVILVATDDSFPPWPVYRGCVGCVIAVLRECRFFEYFVAARDESWIVFDTHMNELVVVGRLQNA
jgi:hypothetical protein